jgi:hypothetical protein
MTTATHALSLVAGPLRVDITEATTAVHIAISGVKPMGFERRKVQAFLFPLVDAYRDDPRRVEIAGQHAAYTGHVVPAGSGQWLAYETKAGAQA